MTHRLPSAGSRFLPRALRASKLVAVYLPLLLLVGLVGSSAPVLKSTAVRSSVPAPAPAPSLVRGVVANNPLSFSATKTLNVPVVRVEFAIGTDPSEIAPTIKQLGAQGTAALLLAGFYKTMPTEDQARSVGAWARAFGPGSGLAHPVTAIELGNETSYPYQYGDQPDDPSYTDRAQAYGRLASIAAQAVRTGDPAVGLLAQADDGGTSSPAWVDGMFDAVPDLDAAVAGWVVHPYGPTYRERLDRTRGQLAAHDAVKPLWVTEWGVASDGGRCLNDNYGWDPCMDSAEAAGTLRDTAAEMVRLKVAAFFVYQLTDHWPSGTGTDKEGYFGALTSDGRTKGDYTDAVRTFLAGYLPESDASVVGSGRGR